MRISHGNLEVIRSNPKRYIIEYHSGKPAHYSFSAFRLFQFATRQYHNNSDNRTIAIEYFEKEFRKKFKKNSQNERRLIDMMGHLVIYFDSYSRLGHHANEAGARINIDLGSDTFICGEVFRVDLVIKGDLKYAVYLFTKVESSWKKELRMPLLQQHFASEYGCSVDQVAVGVYCLATGKHEAVCFSDKEIRDAGREMSDIVGILVTEEKKLLKK